MKTKNVLYLSRVSEIFQIDIHIIQEFAEFGLYPTVELDGEKGIEYEAFDRLKRIISLHNALGVNKEGIDAILRLGEHISDLQNQVDSLEGEVRKLRNYLQKEDSEVLQKLGLLVEIVDDGNI